MAQSSIKSFNAYLNARQQKAAEPDSADPSARVIEILASRPQPMSDLLRATGTTFTTLADHLDRLRIYGLVQCKDQAGGKVFQLTDDGRKAAQLC